MRPTGISTNAGATRFPTSPASARERTETGTITRSVRPFVVSPRAASSACRPIATAVRTTSFTVPPSVRLMARSRSNGDLGGREAASRLDLRVEGTTGGGSHPDDRAHPRQGASDRIERASRRPCRVGERLDRVGRHLADGVADHVLARRRRFGDPRLGGRSERRVRLEIEQGGADQHAADAVGERMVELQQHGGSILRQALEDVQLPQRLRADRAGARAPGPRPAPAGAVHPGTGSRRGAGGSPGRSARRRPRADARGSRGRGARADAAEAPGAGAPRRPERRPRSRADRPPAGRTPTRRRRAYAWRASRGRGSSRRGS